MKKRHILFLVLKIAILIQYGLILLEKQTMDSLTYILTEIIFKTCLFVFIETILFHEVIEGLMFEDKLIISFAGGFLFFDAWFNDFPKLAKMYKEYTYTPKQRKS